MATSVLLVSLLLAVVKVTDGQSTTPEDSYCSYTFKVPATDCGYAPIEDQLTKSLLVALQTQFRLLAGNQEKQATDFRKLTDENAKLRQKIATIEAGRHRSTVNVKQCSKRGLNDQREYGLVFSCDFVKKRDDTVLRIVWNGDLRLIHTGPRVASVRRWFFTINGKECSDPRTIDTQLYVRDAGSNNHRPAYVEGYCRGIAAGDVYVGWNVGDIENGKGWEQTDHNTGDSWTGWAATVRIIVEEIDVESANTTIV